MNTSYFEPIFIIGAPRSGTSAITNALRKAGIPGWEEGHIFDILCATINAINLKEEQHKIKIEITEWAIDFLDFSDLKKKIADYFSSYCMSYWGSSRIIDKTPSSESINACLLLNELWPKSKFIYCVRNGYDNVLSQMRRFSNEPSFNLKTACISWADSVESWRNVIVNLPVDSYIELRYEELDENPESIARKLASFLNMDSHLKTIYSILSSEFPQATKTSTSRKMTGAELDVFNVLCGEQMRKLNYYTEDSKLSNILMLTMDDSSNIELLEATWGLEAINRGHSSYFLHPSVGQKKACILFRNVLFSGQNNISAKLEVANQLSKPVIFQISISDKNECSTSIYSFEKEVHAGQSYHLLERFSEPVYGEKTVMISTMMKNSDDLNSYAWCEFRSILFT